MNNKLKNILLIILISIISISTANAWIGLIAQNGDILNIGKWNEMIVKLNTKLDQSNITGTGNIEINNSGTGVVISFTGSVASSSIPYIFSTNTINILESTTYILTIRGLNFIPNTNVYIPGWTGIINSVNINGPTSININITSGTGIGIYDLVLSNNGVRNTLWESNGVGLIVVDSTATGSTATGSTATGSTATGSTATGSTATSWKDLRLGGDVFTSGTGSGNDIRYRPGMNMIRDINGMYFTGIDIWASWVKFENMSWDSRNNKTIQWIFTRPDIMKIGIGSNLTDEESQSQHGQGVILMHFHNSDLFGLFGNNGISGHTGNQRNESSLSGCTSNILKGKFTNNGRAGSSIFTLYCLPSAHPSDWDNIESIITTFSVVGNHGEDILLLNPFIIPRNGGSQRFIAVKVN